MTPYGIVYKDTVPAMNEGAEIWRKRSGFINKKYFILSIILASVSVIAVNAVILYFRTEKEYYLPATFFITVMEIISVYFLLKSNLRKNVKNIFGTASSKGLKQALLRESDVEFSTPYSKSNYFYGEIEKVIEGINSINIIVENGSLPICISKSGIVKGEAERFILVLKDKMQERYFYENVTGGKSI